MPAPRRRRATAEGQGPRSGSCYPSRLTPETITSWRHLMARHLFAILDDLTANLAELKAALAPLALIGGTVVAEAKKPASAQRRAKGAASGARGPVSAKRRAAMRVQGHYMSAIRTLSAAQRAQVKKIRARKGSRGCHRARAETASVKPMLPRGAGHASRWTSMAQSRATCLCCRGISSSSTSSRASSSSELKAASYSARPRRSPSRSTAINSLVSSVTGAPHPSRGSTVTTGAPPRT